MGTRIVTIERQYATGGKKISEMVAEKLGVPFYNEKILEFAAEKINLSADYLKDVEESTTGSLLFTLAMAESVNSTGVTLLSLSERLYVAEEEIIQELVKDGPCVIVGRCAGHILRNHPDCLNVFIYANHEMRIKTATEIYKVPKIEVESMIRKTDKRRANFYNTNAQKKWGDRDNYHLCLDSGMLGMEKCADIIADAARY